MKKDKKEKKKSFLERRIVSREISKKSTMVVHVPDFKAPSILGDENRFFKGEMEKTKRSMFLE